MIWVLCLDRFGLVRVRENSESIAFYGGEKKEVESALHFYSRLFENIAEKLVWNRYFGR